MRVAVVALTAGGCFLGTRLAQEINNCSEERLDLKLYFPEKFSQTIETSLKQLENCPWQFYEGSPAVLAEKIFNKFEGLIFIMAAGIVVRSIASLLQDKRHDPAVVVMDEKGHFAVSLLSGHWGGANLLAEAVACAVGGQAVISTATDVNDLPAVDLWAKSLGLEPEPFSGLRQANSALVNGKKLKVFTDLEGLNFKQLNSDAAAGRIEIFPLSMWNEAIESEDGGPNSSIGSLVFITNLLLDLQKVNLPYVFLRPKNLVAGVGCKRGTSGEALLQALKESLKKAGRSQSSLHVLASIDLKKDEPGLHEIAAELGAELKFFAAEQLLELSGDFENSPFVKKITGVGAVCEPAALLGGKNTRLILPKTKFKGITVALAEES